MGRDKKAGREAAWRNNQSFLYYYNRLKDLAISRFRWNNLPDTMDARFLELALYEQGFAVGFEDEVMGILGLQVIIGGQLDVYNNPVMRTAYANNGYQKQLSPKDSVLCWNNRVRQPSLQAVDYYAYKLYELDRTIDVNIHAQRTPVMILSDVNQRLTMKNMYAQYDGFEPFIFGGNKLELDNLRALKTDAPYVADKVQTQKENIWNEALTYLGISNISVTKKERLISDEVQRGMGGTYASRNSFLSMREKFCDEMNRMFGLNMSVEFNEEIENDDLFKSYNDNANDSHSHLEGGEGD